MADQQTEPTADQMRAALMQLLKWAGEEGGCRIEYDWGYPSFTLVLPDGSHSHGHEPYSDSDTEEQRAAKDAYALEALVNLCTGGPGLSFA